MDATKHMVAVNFSSTEIFNQMFAEQAGIPPPRPLAGVSIEGVSIPWMRERSSIVRSWKKYHERAGGHLVIVILGPFAASPHT